MISKFNVALGFGNNVDYEIRWDSEIISSLVSSHGITENDIHHYDKICNFVELLGSILYFMRCGLGKEIFIESKKLVEEFAAHFEKKVTMGGTPIRAAIVMNMMGKGAFLHLVTMNDDVRAGLPKNSYCVHSQTVDTSYPHLIVQYKKGDRIHSDNVDVTAKASNRLIYTNDRDNTLLPLSKHFGDIITDVKIILLSGFNIIDSFNILRERIDSIQLMLEKLSPNTIVFMESGCYFHPEYQHYVLERLKNFITIFSMNEEEFQEQAGQDIDLFNPEEVYYNMRKIQESLELKYLLVHTHCWTAIKGDNSVKFQAAMKSATQMATTRFRFGDDITPDKFYSTADLPVEKKIMDFVSRIKNIDKENICCIPVPKVYEKDVTTIGLGDSFVGGFMLPFA